MSIRVFLRSLYTLFLSKVLCFCESPRSWLRVLWQNNRSKTEKCAVPSYPACRSQVIGRLFAAIISPPPFAAHTSPQAHLPMLMCPWACWWHMRGCVGAQLQSPLLASALLCSLLASALQCRLLASALQCPCWFRPALQSPCWFRPALQSPCWFRPSLQSPCWFHPALQSPCWFRPALQSPCWFRPALQSPYWFRPALQVPSVRHMTWHDRPCISPSQKGGSRRLNHPKQQKSRRVVEQRWNWERDGGPSPCKGTRHGSWHGRGPGLWSNGRSGPWGNGRPGLWNSVTGAEIHGGEGRAGSHGGAGRYGGAGRARWPGDVGSAGIHGEAETWIGHLTGREQAASSWAASIAATWQAECS